MKVNITPHRPGQGGILCECWITPGHVEAMSKDPELKAACTECAIRSGNA